MKQPKAWVYVFCVLAGLMDAGTGVLLLVAPLWTLDLMGVSTMPAEPVFMRFVGAFVAGNGFSYLMPFALFAGARRNAILEGMLATLAVVRFFIAGFTGWAMAAGQLEAGWLPVTCSDAVLAVAQVVILRAHLLTRDDVR